MQWADFHFLRPLWLLALLPAAGLVLALWRSRSASTGWDGLIAPQLLQPLMLGRSARAGRLPLLLLGCAWLLAVFALAGPTWERQPQPVYRASLDQVVVLDLSPSMAQTDIAPDRVTRARFAINDLMAQSGEGRSALIVFGAEHHVVAPLTDDVATIEQLLRALSVDVIPAPGDRAAAALRASVQLLAAAESRAAHVILFSDGISDPADSISAAVEIRQAGARLSVIGIGNEHAAQLHELARSGGGVYQPLGARGPHPALKMEAVADFSAAAPGHEASTDRWVEKGVWLLLPLLLLAALGFRRGWLAVLVVVLYQPPQEAMALDWDDLWLTPNQRAKRLLDEGQPQRAAEVFEDPQWRATAHYRGGDFDKAASEFSAAASAYNRANALAKAGKLQEALQSYDEALAAQPDDDARFNRDLVKKLLDQQQQEQQQGEGQEQNKDDNQEQGKNDEQNKGPDKGKNEDEDNSAQNGKSAGQQREDGGQTQNEAQDSKGESAPQQQDAESRADKRDAEQREQQQARDDVSAQAADAAADTAADAEQAARTATAPEQRAERPPSEEEQALQQWLRQVPDDPGGLLRRKFMLEHLQRQKEGKVQ